jgi:uncharacterized membrane protein YphA (DoxX/SURF4 family)
MNRRSMAEAWTPRLLSVMRALLMGLAALLEFFGGLLLMLGLFTRPASFVMSGFMAVAYFMSRAAASRASTG